MIRSSSRIRLVMSCPFGPMACRITSRQRPVRNVPLMLVEFPRNEQAARRDDRFLQLVDDRGLTNTGITGYQRQPGSSADDNALEGVEQHLDLPVTTVQP